jgi:putative ABC transport system permease protein
MNLMTIAWRSIQQRGLASGLTSLSMALGVMLVVAVLSIHGVIADSFRSSTSLGYNLIVGAKGGKLQLTLNTVYYLSQPVENIPYAYYLEFLPAEQRQREVGDPGDLDLHRDGQFASSTAFAIPVCLGDYYGRFRSVGTTPAFFEDLTYGPSADRKYEFAAGRNFCSHSPEHGYWEAVMGATAARELNVRVGDRISPTHGDPDPELGTHHDEGFAVVGVLKPSGTPNDRAVFVNIEGFFLMGGHAKSQGDDGETARDEAAGTHQHRPAAAPTTEDAGHGDEAHSTHADGEHVEDEHADEHAHEHATPLPLERREVTAVLVRTSTLFVTRGLQKMVDKGQVAQAVLPIQEVFVLFDAFVDPLQSVLLLLTAMICVVSGVSILVSIYNSMSERRHEIAVMRALGAGRGTVMAIVLLESVCLCLAGGGVGWLSAHALAWLASPMIAERTGVVVRFWSVELSEALLLPALLGLAIVCGLFPALAAYRTDVAKSLGK